MPTTQLTWAERIMRIKSMYTQSEKASMSKYSFIPFVNTVFKYLEMGEGASPSYASWKAEDIDECVEFCLKQTGADEDTSRVGFAYLYLWHYFFENVDIPCFQIGDFPHNTFVASPTQNLKARPTLIEVQLHCWLPIYTEHLKKFIAVQELGEDYYNLKAAAAAVKAKLLKEHEKSKRSNSSDTSEASSIKAREFNSEILSPKPCHHLGYGIDKIFGIVKAQFADVELQLETAVGEEREIILKWLENTSSSEHNTNSNEEDDDSYTTCSIDTEDDENAGFCGGYRRK